jgi:hypothetical protein
MAKCERREIPQPTHEYVLTLTEDEAQVVMATLSVVALGGKWGTHIDTVYNAMRKGLGVTWYRDLRCEAHGTVILEDR